MLFLSDDDAFLKEMIKRRGKEGKELFQKCMESCQKKEYDKTIEYCNKVKAINPADHEVNFTLGLCYAKKGDFKKAVEYYQKSTNAYPNELLLIAMTTAFDPDLDYRKNFNKAAEYYKNEIAKNPNNYLAYNDLGYVSFILKMDPNFPDYFKKSIELKPDYAQAHYNLALYYLFIGDKNLALGECKKLEKLNNDLAKVIKRNIDLIEKL